jgi:putative spermidine/putrescine transport system ATP-binding protein
MVFQNYALFPHMSVRKNIGFGLRMQNRPKDEINKRVEEAMRLVRLTAQGDKLPGQLSGGQQQRVAIARAIVVEPPLVLMDEPLSNLDAKLRLEMRAEIRRIHASLGCATIYVTHDQDEALSLADRIVVLRDGQTRQIGTPAELYGRPAHADVAEFMGYRNVVKTNAVVGERVEVTIGRATLWATPVDITHSGPAIAAIRPEDLSASPDGPITAVVQTAEYRGRDFFGVALTEDGTELYFRSEHAVQQGQTLRLSADPSRILVYAA